MIREIGKVKLEGKVVLLRAGLDVQVRNGRVVDDRRLVESVRTIKYLLSNNNSVIILSHRGRPKKRCKEFSMDVVGRVLSRMIGRKIVFLDDYKGGVVERKIAGIKSGDVFLFENLRFWKGELSNDKVFARKLASYGDCFVNDSFSTAHRRHASTYGVMGFLPSYAGFSFYDDYSKLRGLLKNPRKPFVVVVGGSKSLDKVYALKNLSRGASKVLVGGTLPFLFMERLTKPTKVTRSLLKSGKIVLPKDFVLEDGSCKKLEDVVKGDVVLDIGVEAVREFCSEIKKARTVLCNGPMGKFEDRRFVNGSRRVFGVVKGSRASVVLGGGETLSFFKGVSLGKNFSVVLGGGAMLDFLSGERLPVVSRLEGGWCYWGKIKEKFKKVFQPFLT